MHHVSIRMKTQVLCMLVGAVASSIVPGIVSAQSFEGTITMRVTMGGGRGGAAAPQALEFLSRGGNVRVNTMSPMGAVAILGLATESKSYVVIEKQKTYMELVPSEVVAVTETASTAKLTRTGKKETVAGTECEHVVVESTDGNGATQRTDMCLTRALGKYLNPLAAMGGNRMPAWQQKLASDGGFPLKVTLADGTVAMEVTKIERHRVSDTLFRIPADFNKMDLPKRP